MHFLTQLKVKQERASSRVRTSGFVDLTSPPLPRDNAESINLSEEDTSTPARLESHEMGLEDAEDSEIPAAGGVAAESHGEMCSSHSSPAPQVSQVGDVPFGYKS